MTAPSSYDRECVAKHIPRGPILPAHHALFPECRAALVIARPVPARCLARVLPAAGELPRRRAGMRTPCGSRSPSDETISPLCARARAFFRLKPEATPNIEPRTQRGPAEAGPTSYNCLPITGRRLAISTSPRRVKGAPVWPYGAGRRSVETHAELKPAPTSLPGFPPRLRVSAAREGEWRQPVWPYLPAEKPEATLEPWRPMQQGPAEAGPHVLTLIPSVPPRLRGP